MLPLSISAVDSVKALLHPEHDLPYYILCCLTRSNCVCDAIRYKGCWEKQTAIPPKTKERQYFKRENTHEGDLIHAGRR